VARNTPDGYSDIVFICGECKKDYDNNTLPWCEKCGRLKRNRNRCFCSHLKAKSTKPLSDKELLSQAFSFRLENKTRELEKELFTAKEKLKIEREEIAKFQEKSEEWSKKQKQELLDKIKSLEEKIKQLEEENRKLKDQQNGQIAQIAQIEIKETKKWPWLKIRK
jgi:septal ring factor EnvC (AmiA/AmiB activator)